MSEIIRRTKEIYSRKETHVVLWIFLLAFALRMTGVSHEFPFIFHPDEPSVIRSALGIRFKLNPGHFDWPHMYFYMNYFLYEIFIKFRGLLEFLGLKTFLSNWFLLLWRDPNVFYFLSRSLSAAMGALSVIPIFLAGKNLFGKKAGYMAALVLTFIPFHAWHSHYALIDVPSMFWGAWALYFSTKIYKSDKIKNYILAGLFIGFSASTKYNGGLGAIVVGLFHFAKLFSNNKNFTEFVRDVFKVLNLRNICLAAFASFVGFVLGTPYALLDFKTFSRTDVALGAFWQFTNVGSVPAVIALRQFIEALFVKLPKDMGYSFMAMFLVSVIVVLYKTLKKHAKPEELVLVVTSIFLIGYISRFEKNRSHYYLMAYPYLSLLIGQYLSKISKKAVVLLIFLIPVVMTIYNSIILYRPSTLNDLFTWMSLNLTSQDHIVYNTEDIRKLSNKFWLNSSDKGVMVENLEGHSGYVFLQVNHTKNGEPIYSASEKRMIQMYNMKYITLISPKLQEGASYAIFSY